MADTFFDDKKEKLTFSSQTSSAANIITGLTDNKTGENVSFAKVSTYKDGSAMDDSKVDNVIYRKKGTDYYKRIFAGGVNVQWFGARGDSKTDDTRAIQKALDLYDNIYIPRGQYLVSGVTVSKKGISVHGDGREESVLFALKKQEFVLAVKTLNNRPGIIEDVSISDLKIDGGYTSKYGLVTNIIFSLIQRINVTSCLEYGIYHYMGYTSTYRDCSARYCGVASLNIFQEGNLLLFERCVFGNNKGSGIQYSSGSTSTFISCSIENNEKYGVLLTYQSDPAITYPPFTQTATELVNFTSCFFENNGSSNRKVYSDIKFSGAPDPGILKVRNVIIKGCHFGIVSGERVIDLANDFKNVVIEDNFFGYNGPKTVPPILIGSFFNNSKKRVSSAISFRNNNLDISSIEIEKPISKEFSLNAISDLLCLTQRATLNISGLSVSIYKSAKLATVYINGTSTANIAQEIDFTNTGILLNTVDKFSLFNIKSNGFAFETKPLSEGNTFYLKVPQGKSFNNATITFPTEF